MSPPRSPEQIKAPTAHAQNRQENPPKVLISGFFIVVQRSVARPKIGADQQLNFRKSALKV